MSAAFAWLMYDEKNGEIYKAIFLLEYLAISQNRVSNYLILNKLFNIKKLCEVVLTIFV